MAVTTLTSSVFVAPFLLLVIATLPPTVLSVKVAAFTPVSFVIVTLPEIVLGSAVKVLFAPATMPMLPVIAESVRRAVLLIAASMLMPLPTVVASRPSVLLPAIAVMVTLPLMVLGSTRRVLFAPATMPMLPVMAESEMMAVLSTDAVMPMPLPTVVMSRPSVLLPASASMVTLPPIVLGEAVAPVTSRLLSPSAPIAASRTLPPILPSVMVAVLLPPTVTELVVILTLPPIFACTTELWPVTVRMFVSSDSITALPVTWALPRTSSILVPAPLSALKSPMVMLPLTVPPAMRGSPMVTVSSPFPVVMLPPTVPVTTITSAESLITPSGALRSIAVSIPFTVPKT